MGLLSVPNTSIIAFSLAHGPGHRQVLFSGGYGGWLGDDCWAGKIIAVDRCEYMQEEAIVFDPLA